MLRRCNLLTGANKIYTTNGRQMASKRLTVDNNGEQAVKERLEPLVARGDNLVEHLQNKHSDSCERCLYC